MQILDKLTFKDNIALAIGFFDGVHFAHKKVISECVNYAKEHNLKSAVLTFKEHPCVSIWKVPPQYIISSELRQKKIADLGVDYLYFLDFNSEISSQTSEQFIELLSKTIKPKAIFTGFNFFFGCQKSGNTKTLKDFSKVKNYKYIEISEQKIDNITVSSTNIRNFIKEGNFFDANKLLDYDFFIEETVIEGNKIGRTIGFPTANLNYPKNIIEPLKGVYSAIVELNSKQYKGIMNFGYKPTISDNLNLICEVHILDFCEDIYSKKIKVYPQKFIRAEKKFDSLDILKNQILDDISSIKL